MTLKEILIEEASISFLEKCPSRIQNILSHYEELYGSVDDLEELFNELTNLINDLRHDSGSYEIVFIANACCNLIDYNNENQGAILTGKFSLDFPRNILELMKSFSLDLIQEVRIEEDKTFHKALDKAATSQRQGRHRVLVVERDKTLISHYQNFFKKNDVSCSVVHSGVEAFHRLLNERFDSLVTSVHVGVIDGLSLVALSKVVNSPNIGIKTLLVAMGDHSVLPLHSMPYKLVLRDENLFSELSDIYDKILSLKQDNFYPVNIRKNLKVLALDDDREVHNLLHLGLSNKNVELHCCQNSKSFFDVINDFKPDLVLLDVGLEHESGVEVLKKLREHGHFFSLPVMFLTARDQDEFGQSLENTDAIGIISKPFSPKTILQEIIELYELYYPQVLEDAA